MKAASLTQKASNRKPEVTPSLIDRAEKKLPATLPCFIQTKLALDHAAAVGRLQRQCACSSRAVNSGRCQCDESNTKASNGVESATASGNVDDLIASSGSAMDQDTRTFMESRFGYDFSRVRIHSGAKANEAATSVGARAFTVGEHLAFAAGEYVPSSSGGRRLLAHELAHVLQQGKADRENSKPRTSPKLAIGEPSDPLEREADRIAERVMAPADRPASADPNLQPGISSYLLQRQGAAATPPAPTTVDLAAHPPVHAPSCGPFRATTDVRGVTWTLEPDPTLVDPATTIAANGSITVASTQAAGTIKAVANNASGFAFGSFDIRSQPTGISATQNVSGPPNAGDYGGVFNHTFTSADGNVASLENVGVGERFIGIANPAGARHVINPPTYPFGGTDTLKTATLMPDGSDNWFLTNAGQLNGTFDEVTIQSAHINVGRFVLSASNPRPPGPLPATMSLRQGLHWWCPQAPAATRWRMPAFVVVAHSRTLRNQGGAVEFVTTVNGVELVDAYTGPIAVLNLNASPTSTPRSAAPATPTTPTPGAAAAGPTVRITVDTLPAAIPGGKSVTFTIVGATLGCSIAPDPANDHAADLTVGSRPGTVTVQAADDTGVNQARVNVLIT